MSEQQFQAWEAQQEEGFRQRAETAGEIVARVRDETVEWDGRRATKLELMIRTVFAQTMRSGKTRDLAQLFAIFDKYGALPPESRRPLWIEPAF